MRGDCLLESGELAQLQLCQKMAMMWPQHESSRHTVKTELSRSVKIPF